MQGAARLYAYLKKNGYDISLKDFNQDAYFALLSRNSLEQTLEGLKYNLDSVSRSKYLREDLGSLLSNNSNNGINLLLEKATGTKYGSKDIFYALLEGSSFVIAEIEKAREVLDRRFFSLSPEEFLANFRMLLCGKAIIDATYYPAHLDLGLGFHGTAYSTSANDMIRATADTRYNFLIPYFRDYVIPVFKQEQPDVVGISITHTSEFIPALTLARMVKSANPETHICLGGAMPTEVAYRIVKNPPLWDIFDSLVVGPGEEVFGELIDHLESGKDLSGVPNLIYKSGNSIRKSEKLHDFDINNACTPEYVSVRPGSALPLETASGCYWGKCIFCYYPRQGTASGEVEYNKKRVRNIELVLEDIGTLRDKYEPSFIGITDSSLHPNRIEQIASYNRSSGKRIHFSAFIRMEKEFCSLAFCQKIAEGGFVGGQVGLESGSQRVNDVINKGIDLKDADTILKNLHQAGILVHLYTMIGTPGETMADAQMTYDFINRLRDFLVLGWQIYPLYVVEHGPLNERNTDFGLTNVPLPDEYLSQFMVYGLQNGLSQEESTQLSVRFSEQLRQYLHPINEIMDIESHKVFLLTQQARRASPILRLQTK